MLTVTSAAICAVSFVATVLGNRVIGDKSLLPKLKLRRALVYNINGALVGALAFSLGYGLVLSCTLGTIAAIGYAIFRQPGPDIAFYAGHGRATKDKAPDPEWILWCLERFHGYHRAVFTHDTWGAKGRQRASVIAGAYRGLWLFPLAIAMALVTEQLWAVGLGFLGLLFGVVYWFTGISGPWRTEENLVLRAELITAAIIIWPTKVMPVILGASLITNVKLD